jgi:hypothetical protein
VFDVGDGRAYALPHRIIHEAENPAKTGRVTAAEILAYSINAGMVQIGPRVEDRVLAGYFAALGYGRAPQTGLGPELDGAYPKLPWKPVWQHASVSFGHEMTVTLWQHAAALATVIRGGEYLPLRLVGRDRARRPALRHAGGRAAARLRTRRVRQGAHHDGAGRSRGDGQARRRPRRAARDRARRHQDRHGAEGALRDLLHAELAHQERHHRDGTRCTKACRATLRGQRPHRVATRPRCAPSDATRRPGAR